LTLAQALSPPDEADDLTDFAGCGGLENCWRRTLDAPPPPTLDANALIKRRQQFSRPPCVTVESLTGT
jgi:hypothetical protein